LFGKYWRRGATAQARRRQAKIVRLALEQLEDRCLLSVLPPLLVPAQTPIMGPTFAQAGVANNQNTTSVAVDPLKPAWWLTDRSAQPRRSFPEPDEQPCHA
jgi:hypothetical protein